MKPSQSFDCAAGFYDGTRELSEPVATHGIQAILDTAGPGAFILDVGTGTGRISVPLLERGANLIGCDLSARMMAKLHQKNHSARLVQADASLLPFPDTQFDVLLTFHVMHLVGPWREALREFQRVLKPGGVYINGRTEDQTSDSIWERAKAFWQSRIEAHGANWRRPGIQDHHELHQELDIMGAALNELEVVRFTRSYTLREEIDEIAKRVHSTTWAIPDDVLALSVQELCDWVKKEYGEIYLDRKIEEEAIFVLEVARFDG